MARRRTRGDADHRVRTTGGRLGAARAALHGALALPEAVTEGDGARIAPPGLQPVDGVVYFTNAHTLGVRTDDALYRFFRGLHGTMTAMHHLFADDIDQEAAERALQGWLSRLSA